jgi:hypothetical protein
MTGFNTVVLFDVENLLGEPSGWKQAAAELSFGDIIAQLRQDDSGLIGGFAVSRAYANWGRPFMSTLRREMTENGVEPRQIFAYDRAAKRNAADIELVIDALDLAYSRPGISTFVMVTRDGGFSSLGRKLHELGKAVVVCADEKCSNALRAVADAFVTLPAPDEGMLVAEAATGAPELSQKVDLGAEGEGLLDEARESAIREIGVMASRDPARLEREGILLQAVGTHFARTIPTLAIARSAYPGLSEFLQWACVNTEYCVMRHTSAPEGSQIRLGLRARTYEHAEVLPARGRRPPQVTDEVDLYRLQASQGRPFLRLPDPEVVAQVLRAVAKDGIRDEELSSVINRVADSLSDTASTADVKFTILALAHSDALVGEPADVPIEDRQYTIVGSRTFADLRFALLSAVRDKLSRRGTVKGDVLEQLIAN